MPEATLSPVRTTASRWLHALGPVATVSPREAVRSAAGVVLGLAVASLLALAAARMDGAHPAAAFVLIPPFGATAMLIFAAPNSPLAQPWPAVIGNLCSALAAIAVCAVVPQAAVAAPLSVGLAMLIMALCRATHPPGGAVAMMIGLTSGQHPVSPAFAFLPVAAGTVLLVAAGAIYARATGRRYPFRHVHEPSRVGTADPDPVERSGLSESELAGILARYRQSLNLGVEDLARLIAAAEIEVAGHRTGHVLVADIMSRDLVTVAPDAPLREVAALFVRHGFTSLPVTGPDGSFHGVIFQLHLLKRLDEAAHAGPAALMDAAQRLLRRTGGAEPYTAAEIMDPAPVTAGPDTPVSALLTPLAVSGVDAIPIVETGRIIGIVTQTDLIAALASRSLDPDGPDGEPPSGEASGAAPLSLSGQKP